MALGVCSSGIAGIIAFASISTSSGLPTVTFYVPETIYLNPADNKTFQYYVNREQSVNGALRTSQDTTGLIYFNCPGATAVTYLSSDADVNLSATSSTNGVLMSTVNYGELVFSISHNSVSLVKWMVSFTYAGHSHLATAYSVVYAPNRNVTANGITGFDYNSSESFASSLLWIQGAQTTNTASVSYQDSSSDHRINYQHATTDKVFDPLVNGVTHPTESNPHDYGSTSSGEFDGATASFSCKQFIISVLREFIRKLDGVK